MLLSFKKFEAECLCILPEVTQLISGRMETLKACPHNTDTVRGTDFIFRRKEITKQIVFKPASPLLSTKV